MRGENADCAVAFIVLTRSRDASGLLRQSESGTSDTGDDWDYRVDNARKGARGLCGECSVMLLQSVLSVAIAVAIVYVGVKLANR